MKEALASPSDETLKRELPPLRTTKDYNRDRGVVPMEVNDHQKVWEILRVIYGMDVTNATLVLRTKDGETDVKYQTIYFP